MIGSYIVVLIHPSPDHSPDSSDAFGKRGRQKEDDQELTRSRFLSICPVPPLQPEIFFFSNLSVDVGRDDF